MTIRALRLAAQQIPEDDPRAVAAIELCELRGENAWERVTTPAFEGFRWRVVIYEAMLVLSITGAFEDA